jgi:hypothetical protein
VPHSNVILAEKRTAPRLATLLACGVKFENSEMPGFVVSCSVTGALLALASSAEAGASVAISLNLPWLKKGIRVTGRVVRAFRDKSYPQATYRCAVEFDGISSESALLMNLVSTRDKLGVRRFR